ncbi:GTPase [Euhalothece natronophila Z-M001]|uniref:GTPase n=1 Tax=Euhalothece natronophila Z-M001 TaxID=522448 RepID=A0A5B8NQ12_9CHRO|nr:GTPase [Euhalothece natronophila]QDZ40245.1 GTPase [Euhalothece natronophila Z-M001]
MIQLKPWQWLVLGAPFLSIILFILIAAGLQIHAWGISWIWGIFILIFLGWRWLLAKWTKPVFEEELEAITSEVNQELEASAEEDISDDETLNQQVEEILDKILTQAQNDPPIWEDWQLFWERCQEVVSAIALIYNPDTKYPLLNIYIPQVYSLIRGTVDDVDEWIQKLSPVLNQVTVGQAYRAYEVYQKVQPSAKTALKVWSLAQWVINPVAAAAKQVSKKSNQQANQQLIGNLSKILRQVALRQLAKRAIALYRGKKVATPSLVEQPKPSEFPEAKTETIQAILEQAEPQAEVEQKPVNLLLVGRTGGGKSSVINTLFQSHQAAVDVLPSTDEIINYHWESITGDALTLWDTPGYEQVSGGNLRDLVLDYASTADLLLLVTPATDPALAMDSEFLADLQTVVSDLPTIAVVTQVDRLRPIREWNPPYDWENGTQPKEKSIREATAYRQEELGKFCQQVFPLVTWEQDSNRQPWNEQQLSQALVNTISPAKELRLARFLRDRETRSVAAAKIIDRYTKQMTTTQGLTNLVKTPILEYLSTFSTGSPMLGKLLMEQIPVEQLPLVVGKLQMAYDLFNLLSDDRNGQEFDLRSLWSLLLNNSASPEKNAFAFGHALVTYWTQGLSISQLREKFEEYLD